MYNPYTGAPLEAEPITVLIDGSGAGVALLALFTILTFHAFMRRAR